MRKGRRAPAALVLALMAAGPAALAEGMPPAVGRISYGDSPAKGAAICSGVLVAPDLVLTAGHCVRGSVDAPAAIRFDAGWNAGRPAGRGQGAKVILSGSTGLAEDVALVVLASPLAPEVATPLPLAEPSPGDFTLHAFRRDAPGEPAPAATCHLLVTLAGLLGFDCPAVSGYSGAPLLQRDAGGWHVVAIMVAASGKGPVRSWAALPPDKVQEALPADP